MTATHEERQRSLTVIGLALIAGPAWVAATIASAARAWGLHDTTLTWRILAANTAAITYYALILTIKTYQVRRQANNNTDQNQPLVLSMGRVDATAMTALAWFTTTAAAIGLTWSNTRYDDAVNILLTGAIAVTALTFALATARQATRQ